MSSINQVQQNLLAQMQQLKALNDAAAVAPAQVLGDQATQGSFAQAFDEVIRAVDTQQHASSQAMAAVDSGQSDDLVGTMIQSQKASVSFSALMQVRNKLASAFDEIMKMPL